MIIVIGATGFIGYYTLRELMNNGYEVVATGRSNKKIAKHIKDMGIQYLDFDLRNPHDIEKLPVENVKGIVLLSGLLPANSDVDLTIDENAADYIKVNTLGTLNVLEYMRKNKINKLIAASSYADVYQSWGKYAIKETEPRCPILKGDHAAYVISKNAACDMIEYYNNQHALQGIIFRLPPVYGVGPHDIIYENGKSKKSGITIFIEKAKNGEPIEIHGDPKLYRDIIYVKDVARAIRLALASEKAKGLYNMTSGVPLTLREQVETVIKVFSENKKSEIKYRPELKNSTPSFLFDMTKAKNDFGFIPEYKDYEKLMIEYKKELESGDFSFFYDKVQ